MTTSTRTALAAVLLAAALPGCVNLFYASCNHTALVPQETYDVDGVRDVRIESGAGSLDVRALPDLREARASGEACASRLDLLDEVRLEVSREGSTLVVAAVYPEGDDFACGLDMVVELPEGLPLVVHDGSGSITVTGTAGADVSDGSGSIVLRDIRGDVRVQDGSGSVDIERVEGDVWITDGSGGIDVAHVSGSVTVTGDGSGSIDVTDVDRDVTVVADGSGSIDVRRVGGAFKVVADGSGGIDYAEVAGPVSVPR